MQVVGASPSDAWGHIHDISLGGVELHTYFSVSKGQMVFLTFSLDEMFKFVNTKGTVVRIREEEGYLFCGVSFDEAVDKNHLREAMQYLLERG